MNWITIAWPMLASACLTLGLLNLVIGLAVPPRAARLLFSLNSFGVAWFAALELELMRTERPEQMVAVIRHAEFASALIFTSLTAFIWVFFRAGNKWLA